jgi:hypothetical protein
MVDPQIIKEWLDIENIWNNSGTNGSESAIDQK